MALALALVSLAGCKRTKDTFTSKLYHRTVSKFNPLYNGEQALLQGEMKLDQQHRDDFNAILPVFKIGDKAAASNVKPDMDRAMEKAAKVIQEHSMMIRNEQKNSYIDDSYLLLGKARFYRREYLEALETFNYVTQQYPDSKNYEEARYWAARTETALGNYLSAKDKFEKMYRSEDVPRKLRGDVFAAYAQLEIDQKHYSVGIQLLDQAIDKSKDKEKKVRWMFIIGQLHAALGNDFEASESFRKVIKKGPPYELLFQAQLSRARNYDVDLQDPEIVFDDLRAMLNDDKNYDNRDQIYYVMALVAEKLDEDGLVEEYLKKSVRNTTINNNQAALSYLKLAEINFDNRMYRVASAYYDSTFTNIDKENKRFEEVKLKKESLGELVKNLEIISTQDSLQALASLTEKQRETRLREIIEKDIEAKAEEKRREEMELQNPFAGQNQSLSANNQSSISGGKWYFYNQNLRSVGVRDFTNRFGNRKLEDNWRRKNKESSAEFDTGNSGSGDGQFAEGGQAGDNSSAVEEQLKAYLKNIPLSEEAMAESHEKIIDAFVKSGAIYKDNFKDYNAAEGQLRELLKRYPDLEIRGRVLYALYRINVLADDTKDADYYKEIIKRDFPDSEYAALVEGKVASGPQDASLAKLYYQKTYKTFADKQYAKSLKMADSGAVSFSGTTYAPQFLLIKAYSLGRTGKTEAMVQTLTVVNTEFGNTDQGKEAGKILAQIGSAKDDEGSQPAPPKEGVVEAPSKYKATDSEAHKYILVVPNTKGLVNNVTIAFTDFNKNFFKNLPLTTKAIYINPQEQMIMVNGLPDKKAALQYVENLQQQKVLEKDMKGLAIKHFVISNSNFQTFYSTKDFEGYTKYYQENYLK